MPELFIDNFAGGGGASTGIEAAIGRSVDIAINHDPDAIAMHRANHPTTRHYCEDVWAVDPVEACGGEPVALAWFSPDCKHFSRAKGGKPVDKNISGLAWVAVRWAYLVRPRVIMMENVPEIQTWGPLGEDSRPIPEHAGETFDGFIAALTDGVGAGESAGVLRGGDPMKARLPARYSIPARNKAAFDAAVAEESRRLFRAYDSYTIDIVIIAVVLVMIRVFGWGSGERATRVPRLIEEVRKTIEHYCDRYDHDCAMAAMRRDLREYGVEYEGRDKNE